MHFFFPFLKELRYINEKGGMRLTHNETVYKFMPIIISCCCDLPAKCDVQGMIGHAGSFACGYCTHPGIQVKTPEDRKAMIRYVKGTENYETRSHHDFIEIYEQLNSTAVKSIKGIKTISCLIAAKDFDMVNGFSVDAMHCVFSGVMKKLMNLWLDTKNHKQPFYISKKNQIILSARLTKIKPISEIIRKPRSLFSRADFKSNEFRSLLFYYLYFALDGLLEWRYIKHFRLLSSAIYALSEKDITFEAIENARNQLHEFANSYEEFYGKSNVTLNLHLLRHLATAVQNLGPLWSQSAFAFEANNGLVVKGNTCTKDIAQQLVWKYIMRYTIKNEDSKICDLKCGGKKVIKLPTNTDIFVREKITENKITIFKNIVFRGVKYTSLLHRDISTVDYFLKIMELIGTVKYYTIVNYNLYALIDVYKVLYKYDHFLEICRAEEEKLVKFQNIDKGIHLKFGHREFITFPPNNYEKT